MDIRIIINFRRECEKSLKEMVYWKEWMLTDKNLSSGKHKELGADDENIERAIDKFSCCFDN